MTDTQWQSRGLCNRFPDIGFVPDPFLGQSSRPAKNVCVHCPVIDDCRAYRTEHGGLGVWGGEDEVDFVVRLGVPADELCAVCDGEIVPTPMGSVCVSCGEVTG